MVTFFCIHLFYFLQSHVPEQIKKVLNAEITGDNHLFTPLKNFPETFSEEERYYLSVLLTCLACCYVFFSSNIPLFKDEATTT